MAMDYRRLEVWKKSMLLVKTVYPLIERLPQEEKYALGNQIRRAVTSIVLNIAEEPDEIRIRNYVIFSR